MSPVAPKLSKQVLVLFGTRPEAIKLAPVIRSLRKRSEQFTTRVASTGQHEEMVQQALDAFGLEVDVQLNAMSSAVSLGRLTGRMFDDVDRLLETEAPDLVVVQGDTTSAMVGAICAFYRNIKVAHVEAGLRTFNKSAPFPEEINRTFISHVAQLHFAPTTRAAENLRLAGVPAEIVHVTGNTVIDALLWMVERIKDGVSTDLDPQIPALIRGKRLVLVTSHRRESFGAGLENICRALLAIVDHYPDAIVVYPVHLNPSVRGPVYQLLGGHPRIQLLPPVGYAPLVWLMQHSHIIVTDSGGLQEEAPSLGKPVLVLRETTERPEAVEAGCARLVGTRSQVIVANVCELLDNKAAYARMAHVKNPFGDGLSGERIATVVTSALGLKAGCSRDIAPQRE